MSLIILDTVKIARKLQTAGLSAAQAEAVTGVLRDVCETNHSAMATKADLRIAIATLKYAILKWLVIAVMAFQTIVIVGALAFLTKGSH